MKILVIANDSDGLINFCLLYTSTREGNGRAKTNAYIAGGVKAKDGKPLDVGMDIFQRGLCLPSDNKMTMEQQNIVIEMIKRLSLIHIWRRFHRKRALPAGGGTRPQAAHYLRYL